MTKLLYLRVHPTLPHPSLSYFVLSPRLTLVHIQTYSNFHCESVNYIGVVLPSYTGVLINMHAPFTYFKYSKT